MTATRNTSWVLKVIFVMEQRWRAVCIERCKHGSGRGLRRPTAEMRQGGAFLLYPIGYADLTSPYWNSHLYAFGRLATIPE